MKGYITNIEKETLENTDYRRVLYTTRNTQLVLMNIQPGDEIGEEVHQLDQFIRIEKGNAKVVIDGTETEVGDGFAIVVPQGARHNVINIDETELKLYTLYAPPAHKDGTIEKTKADEHEEHFDGVVSE